MIKLDPIAAAIILDEHAGAAFTYNQLDSVLKNGYTDLVHRYNVFRKGIDAPEISAQDVDCDNARSMLFAAGYIEQDGKVYTVRKNVLNYGSRATRELFRFASEDATAMVESEDLDEMLLDLAFYFEELKSRRMAKKDLMKSLRIAFG